MRARSLPIKPPPLSPTILNVSAVRNPFCDAAAYAVAVALLAPLNAPEAAAPTPIPPHQAISDEIPPVTAVSAFHPRVAVILGVDRRWHAPLLICRALSTLPAAWWGLRCALTFLGELVLAGDVGARGTWDVEKRFRVTEVFLAILWCSASAYLSYFFTDCLMSRWLLNYTPSATVIRLLTANALNAYITSWVLYLSGGSEDRRLLLPAWISIATTLTVLYHLTQRKINIRKETTASIGVFSIASFISMCSLLLQLHLTRESDPAVPIFVMAQKAWQLLAESTARWYELRLPQPP